MSIYNVLKRFLLKCYYLQIIFFPSIFFICDSNPLGQMKKIIKCILLVNQDRSHNFLNQYRLLKYCVLSNIRKVTSGFEALDYLKQVKEDTTLKPDLIVLNMHMPNMNGSEFLSKFRELDIKIIRNVKIIMLTESKRKNEFESMLQNRYVIDIIQKPLTSDKIDHLFQKHFFPEIGN